MKALVQSRLFWLALGLFWIAVIFYISSLSTVPAQATSSSLPSVLSSDRLAHELMFGLLALVLRLALPARSSLPAYILAFILTVALGTADEIHQTYTAGRVASSLDAMMDGVGALSALVLWRGLAGMTLLPYHSRSYR